MESSNGTPRLDREPEVGAESEELLRLFREHPLGVPILIKIGDQIYTLVSSDTDHLGMILYAPKEKAVVLYECKATTKGIRIEFANRNNSIVPVSATLQDPLAR